MKIVTHDSSFHTDDIFAVATLLLMHPEAEVVRSRDPEVQKTADYVVDTGMVYDPSTRRFDHHQPGGAGARDNGIEYASFGLVWKEYGSQLAEGNREARRIDQKLAQPIDALDNGIALAHPAFKGVRDYGIGDFLISYAKPGISTAERDHLFKNLTVIARDLLRREIDLARDAVKGEDKVKDLYEKSEDKTIIELPADETALPWRPILAEYPEPMYVVYPRSDKTWGAKAVSLPDQQFANRKDFPEPWAGKEGEELQKITGVFDAIFAHRARFMVVAKTREGARKLAQIALNA